MIPSRTIFKVSGTVNVCGIPFIAWIQSWISLRPAERPNVSTLVNKNCWLNNEPNLISEMVCICESLDALIGDDGRTREIINIDGKHPKHTRRTRHHVDV